MVPRLVLESRTTVFNVSFWFAMTNEFSRRCYNFHNDKKLFKALPHPYLRNALCKASTCIIPDVPTDYFGRKRKWLEEQIDRTCQKSFSSTNKNTDISKCFDIIIFAVFLFFTMAALQSAVIRNARSLWLYVRVSVCLNCNLKSTMSLDYVWWHDWTFDQINLHFWWSKNRKQILVVVEEVKLGWRDMVPRDNLPRDNVPQDNLPPDNLGRSKNTLM